jgi:hypothetical protein
LDRHWALLKGYRKPLGKAQRLLESLWAIVKGYRKAIGKWKCPNTRCQPIGEEAELPSGYWLQHGNFHSFPLMRCISVYINKIPKKRSKNF